MDLVVPYYTFSCTVSLFYTCQLFLRYKCEIFILGVLGFLKTTWSFPKIPEEVRSLPKKSEVFRRCPKSAEGEVIELSSKSEIVRKVLSFIHFTLGFRSLHGSELTYFWKLCQARQQQLTFFNQAWEIGPQAWELASILFGSFTQSESITLQMTWAWCGVVVCLL